MTFCSPHTNDGSYAMLTYYGHAVLFGVSTSYLMLAISDAVAVSDVGMTWAHRLMAMVIGGVASLFALHFSKPESSREALIRFSAGCVVAFSFTGTILSAMHVSITTDTVLAAGLVWGSIGWWVLGGLVAWGKAGGPLAYLAQLVQGRMPQVPTTPPDVPQVVKQVPPPSPNGNKQ
jgi:hypothetical protein